MKKADKKKNEIEAQRVFVENLPKTRNWWQEYAFIIAVLALSISIYSAYLSRNEYIAAHRPYVYASSRRHDNGNADVDTIIVRSLNAPARIVNQEFYYMVVSPKENGEDNHEIKYERKFTNESIVYPSATTTAQITVLYDFEKEILATDPNVKLRRMVRIDYKELSTSRKYFFEGYWDYSRKYNVWVTNNMRGD